MVQKGGYDYPQWRDGNRSIRIGRLYGCLLYTSLLEYRADLEIKDSNGNTPFTLAKEAGSQEIEKLLLQWMR